MNYGLARRLTGEILGTFILVFFGGAAAMTNPGNGLLGALAFGLALFVAVLVVGPISGAHVNPTVTLALALRGRFAWKDVPGYVVAQIAGALLAGLAVFATYAHHGVLAGLATTHVDPAANHGVYLIGALLAEAFGTFLLCYTVISLTDPNRVGQTPIAIGIGLSLTVGALAVGAVTGGSFNFARTLGPEIVYSLSGGKGDWSHIWVYLIGPIIGAAVAAFLHKELYEGREPEVVPAPEANTTSKQKTR